MQYLQQIFPKECNLNGHFQLGILLHFVISNFRKNVILRKVTNAAKTLMR